MKTQRTPPDRPLSAMLAAVLILGTVTQALAQDADVPPSDLDPHLASATRYVEAFFAGDQSTLDALQDDTMDGAMSADKMEQARKSLELQLGALESLGTAWFADEVQTYRRYRVPALLERDTMDVLVVVDAQGQIAGFSLVPFVEQLTEEPTAPGPESEIQIGEGENTLPGTLTLPAGDGPFAAVVIVHGSGPHDRDGTLGPNKPLRDIAWGLAERGVAALRYEKRSKHAPQSLVALGDAFTLEHETIADAQEAVRTLQRHEAIRSDAVFVVGHSLGGTAVPRIARMEPPPAGVVSLAGMTLPFTGKIVAQTEYIVNADGLLTEAERDHLESIRELAGKITTALADPASDPSGYLMGAPIGYYRDLQENSPVELARKAEAPILVLQGDRDYQVTLEDFALWSDALADQPFACLVRYPDLNHFFQSGEGPSTPADYQVRASVAAAPLDDLAAWIREGRCPEGAERVRKAQERRP